MTHRCSALRWRANTRSRSNFLDSLTNTCASSRATHLRRHSCRRKRSWNFWIYSTPRPQGKHGGLNMAVKTILQPWDPRQRGVGVPVEDPGAPEIVALLSDLAHTLAHWPAATGYRRGISTP